MGADIQAVADAVDQLQRAGSRFQAALVTDVETIRNLLADGNDGVFRGAAVGGNTQRVEAEFTAKTFAIAGQQGERRFLHQCRVIATQVVGAFSGHQHGELFGIGAIRIGVELDARRKRGASDSNAHGLIGLAASTQRQNVQSRIAQIAAKRDLSAINFQVLPIGAVSSAHGADIAVGGELAARCREFQLTGEARVDATTFELEVVA